MAIDMQKVTATFAKILGSRIENDQLVIPSLPAVATECLAILRNPQFATRELVLVLQRDPLLVVQVLRRATSAASGGSTKMSIEQAVARLGQATMRTILIEACARRLFQSQDRRIAAACAGLWDHSQAVAILARDLHAMNGGIDGDVAYLVGILHDVGKTIVAAYLLDAEMQLGGRAGWLSADDWLCAIRALHQPLALSLCAQWKLPEQIGQTIKDCADYDMSDRTSLGNYVRFANAACKVHGLYTGPCDLDDARSMVMLGRSLLSIDDEVLERLIAGLRDRAHITGGSEGRVQPTAR